MPMLFMRNKPMKKLVSVAESHRLLFNPFGVKKPHWPKCLCTWVVWHPTLKRRIRLAAIVNRNHDTPRYILLFSTNVNQDAEEILQFYQLRFQIEFILRDAKQFTGLSDCQARNKKAIDFHFNTNLFLPCLPDTSQEIQAGCGLQLTIRTRENTILSS